MYFPRRYWLYGEIMERNELQIANPSERRALRGWFPRVACAVCVMPDDMDHNQENGDKKTE